MDRLDAMQVLLAVVDQGSLSAGSRKLNAPLPSVSRKVAELERHLGTRLLIRTSRNVQLTDAGRDYIEAARQIIAQIKDAEQRASGEYDVPRGELKITVTTEFGRIMVVPLACEFLREHPEINLNIFVANRFVDLTDEHVDVAVRIGDLSDSSLMAVKVGTIRAVTCASPDYLKRKGKPSGPDDLSEHDAVVFGNLSLLWESDKWELAFPSNALREGQPRTRVYANDVSAACAAAVSGFGITRLPNYLIAKELRSGALVEILERYAPADVHLLYMKQGLLPLKVRAFIDWMAPRLRQALKDCDGC